jgi:hypothetical protein
MFTLAEVDWSVAFQHVLNIVLTVGSPVIVALIAACLHKLMKKWGIELSAEQDRQLKGALSFGVSYAEEWAKKAKKEGKMATGSEKMDKALEAVYLVLDQENIKMYARDELQKLAEALLNASREDKSK